eukprot:362750-Pelagomonas_calceolata.AAC.1
MELLVTWDFGLQPGSSTAQPAGPTSLCQPNKNVHDIRKKTLTVTPGSSRQEPMRERIGRIDWAPAYVVS